MGYTNIPFAIGVAVVMLVICNHFAHQWAEANA